MASLYSEFYKKLLTHFECDEKKFEKKNDKEIRNEINRVLASEINKSRGRITTNQLTEEVIKEILSDQDDKENYFFEWICGKKSSQSTAGVNFIFRLDKMLEVVSNKERAIGSKIGKMSLTEKQEDAMKIFLGQLDFIQVSNESDGKTKEPNGNVDLEKGYIDFTDFIEERTQNFVGRKKVFQALKDFRKTYESGYVVLTGKPGMGKSACYSKLASEYQYVHHFINSDSQGRKNINAVLGNIAYRLEDKFHTDSEYRRSEKSDLFTGNLLGNISKNLKAKEQCCIVIDGIDELEEFDEIKGNRDTNIFRLPRVLPKGVYVLLSIREFNDLPLKAKNLAHIELLPDSQENQENIREFVVNFIKKKGIVEFIERNKLQNVDFESKMVNKSEGNFMYLHCVLPQIEKGYYRDASFEEIPTGLIPFYEDHWGRMKGKDEKAWFDYKLPIISMLTLSGMTLSVEMIREYAKLPKTAMVIRVLEDWKQFFYEKKIGLSNPSDKGSKMHHKTFEDFLEKKAEDDADDIVLYKLYHSSFKDFLKKKSEVQAEKIDIRRFVSEFILKYQKLYNSEKIAESILELHQKLKGDIRVD